MDSNLGNLNCIKTQFSLAVSNNRKPEYPMWKFFILLVILGSSCSNENEQVQGDFDIKESPTSSANSDSTKWVELLNQFNSPETQGRQNILYELNELNYPRIKTLLETSLEDENKYVKIIAIQSIKENRQVESIDKLIKLFKETKDHTLVSNLTRTFATFQIRKPISALIEKLNSESDMIIYDCIWTIGEIGNDSEIKVLQQFTSNPNVPKVYDDNGILSQTTQFSIGEMAQKSIELIKSK